MQTSVFIAHSCPLVRVGLTYVLKDDQSLVVVGEADDMAGATKGITRLHPDIGTVELSSGIDGVRVCDIVKAKGAETRILLLAMEARGEEVYRAIAAGAAGYLTRGESPEAIRLAIKHALGGEVSISHDAQTAFQEYLQEQEAHVRAKAVGQSPTPLLSAAEFQVLRHTAKGISIDETARLMYISTSTVKNHRQSLFAKLGVANAPAAVYTAIKRGILR